MLTIDFRSREGWHTIGQDSDSPSMQSRSPQFSILFIITSTYKCSSLSNQSVIVPISLQSSPKQRTFPFSHPPHQTPISASFLCTTLIQIALRGPYLGRPLNTNSAVFLTLLKLPLTHPLPPRFEHVCCKFV